MDHSFILPGLRSPGFPIIVHSHLGWDWVWQRPQQILSRLSQHHRVLFVDPPVADQALSRSEVKLQPAPNHPNVVLLQIRIPAADFADLGWMDQERRRLVQSVLAGPLGKAFESPVQWFYDPMAMTAFAGALDVMFQ